MTTHEPQAHSAHVFRLESGYWHVRFSANQFIQWPVGQFPSERDGFGWLTPEHFKEAEILTRKAEGK